MILAGVHLGGWEVATALPRAVRPVPTTVIVADNWLAWAIAHMRVTSSLRVLYRTDPAFRAARLLRAGETLLVLGDDGWGSEPRTYPVRFLDSCVEMPAGMATLSRLCRSPIVGFAVLPVGPRRWRVIVDEPVGPPEKGGGAEDEREVTAARRRPLERAHPCPPGPVGGGLPDPLARARVSEHDVPANHRDGVCFAAQQTSAHWRPTIEQNTNVPHDAMAPQ